MTKEEFFEMNVGDACEFYGKVVIVMKKYVELNDIVLVMSDGGSHRKSTTILINPDVRKLSPVERVDKKISELKAELEKWEAERKSLEIQPGTFYEIEYKIGCLNKVDVFYVEAIRHGGDVVYLKTTRTYEYLDKREIKSFKRITDITELETAWKNV